MKIALKLTAILSIANLIVFALAASWLGGDALNGHALDGHYFLSYKGRLTEVSGNVFTYSRWHAYSVLAMFAVHLLLNAIVRLRKPAPEATSLLSG